MRNAEACVGESNDLSAECRRLVSQLRNARNGLDRILAALGAALGSDNAELIFGSRTGQPSFSEMREELAYLQQHASNETVASQEPYRIKLSRLLHSVSIALAHKA